jgi:26 proteasome complex subunit DSS1
MSSAASSSKPAETKVAEKEKPKEARQAQLGVLEEDDEFEEFPVAG